MNNLRFSCCLLFYWQRVKTEEEEYRVVKYSTRSQTHDRPQLKFTLFLSLNVLKIFGQTCIFDPVPRQGDIPPSPLWSATSDWSAHRVALTFIATGLGAVETIMPVKRVLLPLLAWHAKDHKTKNHNTISRWRFIQMAVYQWAYHIVNNRSFWHLKKLTSTACFLLVRSDLYFFRFC